MKRNKTRTEMLDFIRKYRAENGYSPSYRDISDGLGVSIATVTFHLHKLREAGLIQFTHKISRSIIPTE